MAGENPQRANPEQEKQLRQLFGQIGPQAAMHIFSSWLNESTQSGTYAGSTEYRDTVTGVVTNLRDAERSLTDIRV